MGVAQVRKLPCMLGACGVPQVWPQRSTQRRGSSVSRHIRGQAHAASMHEISASFIMQTLQGSSLRSRP